LIGTDWPERPLLREGAFCIPHQVLLSFVVKQSHRTRGTPLKYPSERHDEERVSTSAHLAPAEPVLPGDGAAVTAPVRSVGTWVKAHLARRRWPAFAASLMVIVGMAFMFQWNPLFHHLDSWATPGDMWGIFRGAHYVGWGYLGGIYTQGTGIVTLPGMPILLAPVALLTGHFHLSESFMPYFLAKPTAALVLMPAEILLASTVVFASDALAEQLGVPARRRVVLCVAVATLAWPTAAVWGHGEDSLAMAFALYALLALAVRRPMAAGWLLGLGIAMQPLVALLLPLFLAQTPTGRRVLVAVRAVALPVFLVAVAFAGDASDAYRAMVVQPTPPSVNHATPWVYLAPKVSSGSTPIGHTVTIARGAGHQLTASTVNLGAPLTFVAGGPGRVIDVLLVLLLSAYLWRRPQPMSRFLWIAAVVLASRCVFEAVMTPYYLVPPLILALILAARCNARRFWAAVVVSAELTVFAYHHLEPWVFWLPIVVGQCAVLALCYPSGSTSPGAPEDGDDEGERSWRIHSDQVDSVTAEESSPRAERESQPALV